MSPATNQPGGKMIKLCQFDLQFAFRTLRTLRKDVEDQAGSINHAALQRTLQIALLSGRQRVIENDKIGFVCSNLGRYFLDLALAGVGRRIGAMPSPENLATNDSPGRFGKQVHFFKLLAHIATTKIELDDDRTFASGRAFKHQDTS